MNTELTQKQLKDAVDYDPLTGIFTRRTRTAHCMSIGDVAGCPNGRGYLKFGVNGKSYYAHRLAWLFVYGQFPHGIIDHIDGNRANNRIDNLRDVSRTVNNQNQRRAQSRNKSSGLLGVSFNNRNKNYVARICANGQQNHLGVFTDKNDAHQAYLTAKRHLHIGNTL